MKINNIQTDIHREETIMQTSIYIVDPPDTDIFVVFHFFAHLYRVVPLEENECTYGLRVFSNRVQQLLLGLF